MGIRPVREAALAAVAGAEQAAPACRGQTETGRRPDAHAVGARWRVTDPQVMRRFLSHAGKAFLVLPVPWGIQPGTFGNVMSASASRV